MERQQLGDCLFFIMAICEQLPFTMLFCMLPKLCPLKSGCSMILALLLSTVLPIDPNFRQLV